MSETMNDEIRALLFAAAEIACEEDLTDDQLYRLAFMATFALVNLKKLPRGRIAIEQVTTDAKAEMAKRKASAT